MGSRGSYRNGEGGNGGAAIEIRASDYLHVNGAIKVNGLRDLGR